jgi:hypothetical protein
VEAPFAAVRRHVAANEPPPPTVDDLIRVTYEAALTLVESGSAGSCGQAEKETSR